MNKNLYRLENRSDEATMNSKLKENTISKTLDVPSLELYAYIPPSNLDGQHQSVNGDLCSTQNGDLLTKREMHQIHNYSFSDVPVYNDFQNSLWATESNENNGAYLVPLQVARVNPNDSVEDSSSKKGIFKNLKRALFAKKNSKRPKVKQTLSLPVIDLSNDYKRPLFNRTLSVSNLRPSYSMDYLNVIENTIVWRELSETKSLTLKNERIENDSFNNSICYDTESSDIITDLLKNNTFKKDFTNESYIENLKRQPENGQRAPRPNDSPFLVYPKNSLDNLSVSQGDMFFGEEIIEPLTTDQRVAFHYTKHQNKKIIPRYYKPQLQYPKGMVSEQSKKNYDPNIKLLRLKNSLSSSTSSTRSSASSSSMPAQDESNFLSLSSLSINSPEAENLLDRHLHAFGANSRRCQYLSQMDRWDRRQAGFAQRESEHGASIDSSGSSLGSYSGSYVAKVKRSVHFNGSDEVFEYIPVNSGDRKYHQLKQGTISAKHHGRKTKMATYL